MAAEVVVEGGFRDDVRWIVDGRDVTKSNRMGRRARELTGVPRDSGDACGEEKSSTRAKSRGSGC